MQNSSFPIAICVAALFLLDAPAFGDSLPVRKSGLWEITTVAEEYGMKRFQTCITSEDPIVPGIGDKNCDAPEIKSVNSEAIVNITCRMKGGTQFTSLLLSGDFQKWYRARSKITFTFKNGKESRAGVSITAKYLGACKPPSPEQRQ